MVPKIPCRSSWRVKRQGSVFPLRAVAARGVWRCLAFLGSIYGAPTVPLGMDQRGQSGYLYEDVRIDVDEVVNAAMLALELNEG